VQQLCPPARFRAGGHKFSCICIPAKNDPFFLPPGAEAFKRDNPNAEVHFYDTGHFALETHHQEIAGAIRDFLDRKVASKASAA
jgi:predicted alpha/beta hydrolase family esterase